MGIKSWERLKGFFGFITYIGLAWDFFQDLLDQFSRIFFGEIVIKHYNLINAMEVFVLMNLKSISMGTNQYSAFYYENDKFRGYVPVKEIGDKFQTFIYNYFPIFVKIATDDDSRRSFFCRYPKLLVNPENIVSEALAYLDKHESTSRFFIKIESKDNSGLANDIAVATSGCRDALRLVAGRIHNDYLSYIPEDVGNNIAIPFNMEDLCLTAELMDCCKELEMWLESRQWYQEGKIPWRRGWLLHGDPGTGKTTFMVSLAKHFGIPIVVFDLSTLSNYDLRERWAQLSEVAPCIVLLEDLDAIFKGRKNITKNQSNKLTFDCLLNTIDGANSPEGIFLSVTTNHPETLDRALGRVDDGKVELRPGRIDRAIEFCVIDKEMREKMAHNILHDYPKLARKLVKKHVNVTVAEFQEVCVREAMKLYWANRTDD